MFFVGSGNPDQAKYFRERVGIDATVLCNPDLAAYQAAGMKRGVLRTFGPRAVWNVLGSVARGYKPKRIQGDALQQGGVLVVSRTGEVLFHFADEVMGTKWPLDEVLAQVKRSTAPAAS